MENVFVKNSELTCYKISAKELTQKKLAQLKNLILSF